MQHTFLQVTAMDMLWTDTAEYIHQLYEVQYMQPTDVVAVGGGFWMMGRVDVKEGNKQNPQPST